MAIRDFWFYKRVAGKQPYRFLLQSARNIFIPLKNAELSKRKIYIEVSSICNARCIFCPYRLNFRSRKLMSIDTFQKLTSSALALGYTDLDLTPLGGDLFFHKDAVTLISVAKQAGFKHIEAFTNGISLHMHNAKKLLQSGINMLNISFPGFDKNIYKELFGVSSYFDFEKSITGLLTAHKELKSTVIIGFEPRTYLSLAQIKESGFYRDFLSKHISEHIILREPVRVFDSWGGEIKKNDLIKGMKIDINPLKSLYPVKKVHLCHRLLSIGILANGDVRLCNCRYDSSIETENDQLYIDNLDNHASFVELLSANRETIFCVRHNFIHGKMPTLCSKCPFYVPVKYAMKQQSSSELPVL